MVRRILIIVVVLLVVAQFIRPLPANAPIDPQKTLASTGDLPPDVAAGRREFNIDQWLDYTTKRQLRKLDEICKQVKEHDMPLPSYLWIHHDARLSGDDVKILCTWVAGETSKISRAKPRSGS